MVVERRIIGEIESPFPYPEWTRESDRIPSARELVVSKLPYVVFIQLREDTFTILNMVQTKRQFPA